MKCGTIPHRLYTLDVGMDVDYTVEVRYQGRQISMQQGIVKDFIGPYATAVLRFPQPHSKWVSLSARSYLSTIPPMLVELMHSILRG